MKNRLLLAQLAALTGYREDSRETAAFARQLEVIQTQTYDIEYEELQARKFVPQGSGIPAGAKTITYRQWDRFTAARIASDYAGNIPRVTAMGKEFTSKIVGVLNSYSFSVQELRESAMAGAQLDSRLPAAAREGHELQIDEVIAFGNPESGLKGFLNHPNVPLVVLPNGAWPTRTTDQVLEDLRYYAQSVATATKLRRTPDTLLVDTATFTLLQKPVGANLDSTILEVFLRTSPYIKNVDQWIKLDTADAAGTGPRMVCYQKKNDVLEYFEPLPFTQHPAQLSGLETITNCESRIGGCVVRYPLAIAYCDNHN